jgi:hypothetical protein
LRDAYCVEEERIRKSGNQEAGHQENGVSGKGKNGFVLRKSEENNPMASVIAALRRDKQARGLTGACNWCGVDTFVS